MLKLGNCEAIVLRMLQRHGFVTRERLFDAIYGNRPDGGPNVGLKVIDQWVFRLRRKLARAGLRLKIENQHSQGYRLVCE